MTGVFTEQINELGRQSSSSINEGFSGINRGIDAVHKFESGKIQAVKNKYALIDSVSKELGAISGEFVDEQKKSLLQDIKGTVIEDRKLGNLKFGKTVNMESLNSFNDRIEQLAKMAKNSRLVDKIYKQTVDSVDKSKLINEVNKPTILNEVMRSLSDSSLLSNLDTPELMQQIDSVVKGGANMQRVLENIIGEVGTQKVTLPDGKGGSVMKEIPNILDIDNQGNVSFNNEGSKRFGDAFNEARELGFSASDFQTEIQRYIQNSESTLNVKKNFTSENERLRNQKLRRDISGSEPQGQSIDVLSNFIMRPEVFNIAGIKKQLTGILKTQGIEFERNNNSVTFKKDKTRQIGDSEFTISGDSVTYDLSDPKDIQTMRSFLQKVISDENIKDLDNLDIIKEGFSQMNEILNDPLLNEEARKNQRLLWGIKPRGLPREIPDEDKKPKQAPLKPKAY